VAFLTVHSLLYHVTENTANQNTGKPLYILRVLHYIQPSHRARAHACVTLTVLATIFYGTVLDSCLTLSRGIP